MALATGIHALAADARPVHRPPAPDAPIPGAHWYPACNPDRPRVNTDGVCEDCGEAACPVCGKGGDHDCEGSTE